MPTLPPLPARTPRLSDKAKRITTTTTSSHSRKKLQICCQLSLSYCSKHNWLRPRSGVSATTQIQAAQTGSAASKIRHSQRRQARHGQLLQCVVFSRTGTGRSTKKALDSGQESPSPTHSFAEECLDSFQTILMIPYYIPNYDANSVTNVLVPHNPPGSGQLLMCRRIRNRSADTEPVCLQLLWT